MKRLLILLLFVVHCGLVTAEPYSIEDIPNVQISNRYKFTSNPDGILNTEAVAQIDSICYQLREQNIAQIAVVAVKEIDSDDVFEFAFELFSTWGVGTKSDRGMGILLVEDLREIRFITGYGVEGALPDAICKRIQINYMLPYFREGDYSSGMVSGVEAIREILNGEEFAPEKDESADNDAISFFGTISLLFAGIFGLFWLLYRSVHRCPNCKKVALKQESSEIISRSRTMRVYEDTFVCKNCKHKVKRKRNVHIGNNSSNRRGGGGPIIGGGFGGGSFGGGGGIGGGWGGGSFGGGGAGSKW